LLEGVSQGLKGLSLSEGRVTLPKSAEHAPHPLTAYGLGLGLIFQGQEFFSNNIYSMHHVLK